MLPRQKAVLAATVAALALVLAATSVLTTPPTRPDSSSLVVGPTGLSRWAEVLRRSGHTVHRQRVPFDLEPPALGETVVVVAQPDGRSGLEPEEAEPLRRFLDAGGSLVMVGLQLDDPRDPLGRRLETEAQQRRRRMDPMRSLVAVSQADELFTCPKVADAPETVGVQYVESTGKRGYGDSVAPLVGCPEGTQVGLVTSYPGRVVVVADPAVLQNFLLGAQSNAALAAHLVQTTDVRFAEHTHDAAIPSGLWSLGGNQLAGALGLACAIGLALAAAPRRRAATAARPTERRSLPSQVGSAGHDHPYDIALRHGAAGGFDSGLPTALRNSYSAAVRAHPDATTASIEAAVATLAPDLPTLARMQRDALAALRADSPPDPTIGAALARPERPPVAVDGPVVRPTLLLAAAALGAGALGFVAWPLGILALVALAGAAAFDDAACRAPLIATAGTPALVRRDTSFDVEVEVSAPGRLRLHRLAVEALGGDRPLGGAGTDEAVAAKGSSTIRLPLVARRVGRAPLPEVLAWVRSLGLVERRQAVRADATLVVGAPAAPVPAPLRAAIRRFDDEGGSTRALLAPSGAFEAIRPYTEADDVRSISWRATARVGTPVVNQLRAMVDRDVLVAVDLGRSALGAWPDGTPRSNALVDAAGTVFATAAERGERTSVLLYADRALLQTAMTAARSSSFAAVAGAATPVQAPSDPRLVLRAVPSQRRITVVLVVHVVDDLGAGDLVAAARLLAVRHRVVVGLAHDPWADLLLTPPTRSKGAANLAASKAAAAAGDALSVAARAVQALEAHGVAAVLTSSADPDLGRALSRRLWGLPGRVRA